jgi:hypothetical protein
MDPGPDIFIKSLGHDSCNLSHVHIHKVRAGLMKPLALFSRKETGVVLYIVTAGL